MLLLGLPGLGSRLQVELGLRHVLLTPCGSGAVLFSSSTTGVHKTEPRKHISSPCSPHAHPHPPCQRKSLDQVQQ